MSSDTQAAPLTRADAKRVLEAVLDSARADAATGHERTRNLRVGAAVLTWLSLAGATGLELRALRDAIDATEPSRQRLDRSGQ